jgi:hypothetical protein
MSKIDIDIDIYKINEHFKLPIYYNEDKMEVDKHIIDDLELNQTIDPSGTPIYDHIFQPKTDFGKLMMVQFSKWYTTDKRFLKENQKLLKLYKPRATFDYQPMMDIWSEMKNETGFREKYNYVDWSFWEHLNHSETFLQIMSIYNLASPLLSLFIPIIILIIPFVVIQLKGMKITFSEYFEVLKIIASNHAVGKLFTQFNQVEWNEKIYIMLF